MRYTKERDFKPAADVFQQSMIADNTGHGGTQCMEVMAHEYIRQAMVFFGNQQHDFLLRQWVDRYRRLRRQSLLQRERQWGGFCFLLDVDAQKKPFLLFVYMLGERHDINPPSRQYTAYGG